MTRSSAPEDLAPALTTCPFCGSAKVTSADEKADPADYRRCEACGEVWNGGRLPNTPFRSNQAVRWR